MLFEHLPRSFFIRAWIIARLIVGILVALSISKSCLLAVSELLPIIVAERTGKRVLVGAALAMRLLCAAERIEVSARITTHFIVLLLLRDVTEDIVGGTDVLELIRGSPSSLVRMVLMCELVVACLDLFLAGVRRHTEDLVVVDFRVEVGWLKCTTWKTSDRPVPPCLQKSLP